MKEIENKVVLIEPSVLRGKYKGTAIKIDRWSWLW